MSTPSTNCSGPQKRRGVYLISHPRSCSNLFMRMLSEQPHVRQLHYFFTPALMAVQKGLPNGPLKDMPESEREEIYGAYRECYEKFEDELLRVERDQVPRGALVKEHAAFMLQPGKVFQAMHPEEDVPPLQLQSKLGYSQHSNPTVLPDELLLSMQPIFLIRNPIRMFPSFAGASRKASFPGGPDRFTQEASLSLTGPRQVYEWYTAQADGPAPKILDADDLMSDPSVVRKLCAEVGLDPESVIYEWAEKGDDPDPLKKAFLSTVDNSSGILPGFDAKGLTVDEEVVKWREQFGEQNGNDIAAMVRAAMPDYEYLRNRRVTSS